MKKILIFSLMTLVVLLAGCSVNSTTGLIKFTNNSDKDVTVKIGATLTFVSKGTTYDYYFISDIKGKISADGCEEVAGQDISTNPPTKIEEAAFKLGFMYDVHIIKDDGKYTINAGPGLKAGADFQKDGGIFHDIWTDKVFP